MPATESFSRVAIFILAEKSGLSILYAQKVEKSGYDVLICECCPEMTMKGGRFNMDGYG